MIDDGVSLEPTTFALLRLFEELVRCDDMPGLERAYLRRATEVVAMPMRGLYVFSSDGWSVARCAAEEVSDLFLARYEALRGVDPVLHHTLEAHVPADNLMLARGRWREHQLYREALYLHDMGYVIQAPVIVDDRVIGMLAWGGGARRGPAADARKRAAELERAGALGRVVGAALEVVRERVCTARTQRAMAKALEQSHTSVAITDATTGTRELNASARALLDAVVDGDAWIDRLTARSGGRVPRSNEADVQLVGGERTRLHVHTETLDDLPGTTVSLLRLGRAAELPAADRAQLTAREAEVAALVAEGLTDGEIAERLVLSPYTVRQYVKSIYRKLGVDSRVRLTRRLLGYGGS